MIKIEFTKEELNIILAGLAELPAKFSFDLIIKIKEKLKSINEHGNEIITE